MGKLRPRASGNSEAGTSSPSLGRHAGSWPGSRPRSPSCPGVDGGLPEPTVPSGASGPVRLLPVMTPRRRAVCSRILNRDHQRWEGGWSQPAPGGAPFRRPSTPGWACGAESMSRPSLGPRDLLESKKVSPSTSVLRLYPTPRADPEELSPVQGRTLGHLPHWPLRLQEPECSAWEGGEWQVRARPSLGALTQSLLSVDWF